MPLDMCEAVARINMNGETFPREFGMWHGRAEKCLVTRASNIAYSKEKDKVVASKVSAEAGSDTNTKADPTAYFCPLTSALALAYRVVRAQASCPSLRLTHSNRCQQTFPALATLAADREQQRRHRPRLSWSRMVSFLQLGTEVSAGARTCERPVDRYCMATATRWLW